MKVAKNLGMKAIQIEATEKINQDQNTSLIRKILDTKKDRVSLLGLSFKNGTPVINESPSIKVIEGLLLNKKEIFCYDPVPQAVENTKLIFGDKITYCSSFQECVKEADCIVILNPTKEYSGISKLLNKDNTVIDCWRYFDSLPCNHIKLGVL
jgi:UDPglucose 6-dehydrogenase